MTQAIKIVIWGAGGHAKVVADILRCIGGYEIAGFLDDANPLHHGQSYCGAMILGGKEQLPRLREQGITKLILGFGDCAARLKLWEFVKNLGFDFVTAIHPRATVAAGVTIGEGTVIAAGAVINPGSRLGANVIINTCASVDHDCIIEDGAHLSPGARLGGKVTIGRGAWLALNSTVVPGTTIGECAVIGAGAVVLSNIPPRVLAYGIPARIIRPTE